MRKQLLIGAIAVILATPAAAAPWVRGYAFDNYEMAFHFGARADGATEAPGSDCPKGTIPDNNYRQLLSTKWRTEAEIAPLLIPADKDPDSQKTHFALETAISYRGFRRGIETYINPFAAPDPGMQEVTGGIAEGFDLDGNAKTGGFTSPEGERGIDNAFYRAWGCVASYRAIPYHAYMSQRGIDKMQEGLYTIVIRMSGNKDPMNDDNVTLEVAYSPDPIVKSSNGVMVSDYSFRSVKSTQYTRLKARIKNGVVDTEQVAELRLPDFAWFPAMSDEAIFHKGKIRLVIGADGNASGLVGGYRDWHELYSKDTWNQGQYEPTSATTREVFNHDNRIAMYYALKRNADGMPDPKTGQNLGISTAYRFTAKPAYVVDSPTAVAIRPWVATDANRRQIASIYRGLFLQAVTTKVIQKGPVAPAGKDHNGKAVPAPNGAHPAPAAQPGKDGLRVDKDAPATVASAAPLSGH